MSRRHLDPSSSSWRDSHQRGYERDDDRGHDNDHHRPSAYAASKFRARPSSSATTPPWQRRRGGDSQWRETKQEEGLESTRYSQGGGDSADEGFGRYENEGPPEDGYRHERRVAPTARRHSSRSRSGSRDFNDGGVNNSPPDLEDDNRRDLEEGDEENCSEDGFVDDDEPGFIDDVDDDVEDDVDDGQPCCDDSPRSRHQTHHSYHRHHHHRRHRSRRRDIGRRPSSRHRSRSRPRRHVAVESEDDEGGYDEEALEEQQNGGRSRRPDHRDREKEKAKRARRRDRDYARKMAAAQQAPLHMAMMQSMMGMRLGMIPPAAMAPTGPLAAGVPPPGFGGPRPPMMQMPPRMPQPRQANMPRPPRHRGPKPAADAGRTPRRSAKDAIEALIEDHNLSAGCAWMLRSLPPDRQKLAAKIDPSGRDDPSGFVAEQLRTII